MELKLSQPNISPSCLEEILQLLTVDVLEDAKRILKEYEVEFYE